MILTFADGSEDLHIWAPRSGANLAIDTGNPVEPAQYVTYRPANSFYITWPELKGRHRRNPDIEVGQEGAFLQDEPTAEERDAWLLECCKLAARHFGAATATQWGVEYAQAEATS